MSSLRRMQVLVDRMWQVQEHTHKLEADIHTKQSSRVLFSSLPSGSNPPVEVRLSLQFPQIEQNSQNIPLDLLPMHLSIVS